MADKEEVPDGISLIGEITSLIEALLAIGDQEKAKADREAGE